MTDEGVLAQDLRELLFRFDEDADGALGEFESLNPTQDTAERLIPILLDWRNLVSQLKPEEQNVVLWRIQGQPIWLGFWLGTTPLELDLQVRLLEAAKQVTLAIPHVHGPEEPMQNGYFMWWDSIASEAESPEVASACLEILADLMMNQDGRIQYAALHGLGHLGHPEKAKTIDRYIQFHPECADDWWIGQCRDGTVM